jgi:hypothetical protein
MHEEDENRTDHIVLPAVVNGNMGSLAPITQALGVPRDVLASGGDIAEVLRQLLEVRAW